MKNGTPSAAEEVVETVETPPPSGMPVEEVEPGTETPPPPAETPESEPPVPGAGEEPVPVDEKIAAMRLSPEMQEKVNARIGEIVAERKTAEAARKALETEVQSLREAAEGHLPQVAARHGLLRVSGEEAKPLKRYDDLRAWNAWCAKHLRDGYTATGEEGDTRSYTADEVAERKSQIEEELWSVAGKANSIVDSHVARLREVIALGEAELAKRKAAPGTRTPGKPPVPPRAPSVPAGSRPPVPPSNPGGRSGEFSSAELARRGGGRTALQTLYESTM